MRLILLSLPLVLLGCTREPRDDKDSKHTADDTDTGTDTGTDSDTDTGSEPELVVSLLPEGQPNMIFPFDVTLNPATRRGYVSANTLATVMEFDLDKGTATRGWSFGEELWAFARLAVDGMGIVWMTGGRAYPIGRIDPETNTTSLIDVGSDYCLEAVGLDEGGVVLVCPIEEDSTTRYLRLDSKGSIVRQKIVDGTALCGRLVDGNTRIASLIAGDGKTMSLMVMDIPSFETNRSWVLDRGWIDLVQGSDGSLFLVGLKRLMKLGDDGTGPSVYVGSLNMEAFAVGDQLAVLDELGAPDGSLSNWSLAHVLDLDMVDDRVPFKTGKSSTHGHVDTNTNLLWVNSAGTSEVIALDTETHSVSARAKVGVSPETILQREDDGSVVFITGRLSGMLSRIDMVKGSRLDSPLGLNWPVAPVFSNDSLWMLDQLDDSLWQVDPDTLQGIANFPLGQEVNDLIVFNRMIWNESRGTLMATQTKANTLVEIDPSNGVVVNQWPLEGVIITNTGVVATLEVFQVGDTVVTFRSKDGAITVIDPDQPEPIHSFFLDLDQIGLVDARQISSLVYINESQSRAYIGSLVFDTSTWTELPELRSSVTRVLGERSDGNLVGWIDEGNRIVVVGPDAGVLAELALEPNVYGESGVTYLPHFEERILYMIQSTGQIRSVSIADL